MIEKWHSCRIWVSTVCCRSYRMELSSKLSFYVCEAETFFFFFFKMPLGRHQISTSFKFILQSCLWSYGWKLDLDISAQWMINWWKRITQLIFIYCRNLIDSCWKLHSTHLANMLEGWAEEKKCCCTFKGACHNRKLCPDLHCSHTLGQTDWYYFCKSSFDIEKGQTCSRYNIHISPRTCLQGLIQLSYIKEN